MKKQFFVTRVCGLCIGIAGAVVPLSSVHAADDYVDRYLNGYLNDPYSNEVAPDTQSVLPRGAEGPIRTDARPAEGKQMRPSQERSSPGTEENPPAQSSGAQGSIGNDSPAVSGKPKVPEDFLHDQPGGRY